ncbi:MAG: hypothetical protein RL499_1121, partial [Actinomycetota bacterium]
EGADVAHPVRATAVAAVMTMAATGFVRAVMTTE